MILSEDLLYATLSICPIVIEYLICGIGSVLKADDAAMKCCQKLCYLLVITVIMCVEVIM